MRVFILPENSQGEKVSFSKEIDYSRESVSVRTESICRGFRSYFSPRDYLVCEIENGRYNVKSITTSKMYIFQMYSDMEMRVFASQYFFPALSHPGEPGMRKKGYWNQAPDHVSWGGYFIGENGEKILTNSFKKI